MWEISSLAEVCALPSAYLVFIFMLFSFFFFLIDVETLHSPAVCSTDSLSRWGRQLSVYMNIPRSGEFIYFLSRKEYGAQNISEQM